MIELYREFAAQIIQWQGFIKATMLDSKIIKCAKSAPGKVSKFWVISLAFKFSDHCNRDDDEVLCESVDGTWICEKDAGIEYVCDPRLSGQGLPLVLAMRSDAVMGRKIIPALSR
jgi:hypothetical protein